MAGRPSRINRLDVWMNGELVGEWAYAPTRGHSFTYDRNWLDNPLGRPLSLSLPAAVGTLPLAGEPVEFYFDNLLPDSAVMRTRIAAKFGAKSAKTFDLLAAIGRDCVGAVQLLPKEHAPPHVRMIEAEPLNEEGVAHILDNAVSGARFGAEEEDPLRISIAGVQEKTALLWHEGHWCRPHGATPTTHIFKLPLGDVGAARVDFSSSVENEWLCSRIMQAYGLPVATCEVARFGRHKVLAVERFDRKNMGGWWARLPQEDFCQVKALSPTQKYENNGGPGMPDILDILRGSEEAEPDRTSFLKMQLLFWILAAPDGHAKNFSIFIKPAGRFQLTPVYDVLSAWPVIGDGPMQFDWHKIKLAMAVRSRNAHYLMKEIKRRHWLAVAKKNAVGEFNTVVEDVIHRTPKVIETVAARLPADFPAWLIDRIFAGMRMQIEKLRAGDAC